MQRCVEEQLLQRVMEEKPNHCKQTPASLDPVSYWDWGPVVSSEIVPIYTCHTPTLLELLTKKRN